MFDPQSEYNTNLMVKDLINNNAKDNKQRAKSADRTRQKNQHKAAESNSLQPILKVITGRDGIVSNPVETQSVAETRNNLLGRLTINQDSGIRDSKQILKLNELNYDIAKRERELGASKTSKVTERSQKNELKTA